jgi:hypothetical protein
MSDEKRIDHSKFEIGHIGNPTDPDAIIVSIPIKAYAEQGADGMDMFYGKCRRLEAIGATLIKNHAQRKQQQTAIKPGVILPDGTPGIVA